MTKRKRRWRKPLAIVSELASYVSVVGGHCDKCAASNKTGFRRLIRELRAALKEKGTKT